MSLVFAAVALFLPLSAPARADSTTRTDPADKLTQSQERRSWGTDLSLSAELSSGNSDYSRLSAAFSAFRNWDPYTAYLSGKLGFLSVGGSTVKNDWNVAARADRKLEGGPWRVFVFTTHGRNSAILVDYRGQLGAGPWLDFKTGEAAHGLSLALAFQYETYSTGDVRRIFRLPLRYQLSVPLSPTARAGSDLFLAPSLADSGDVRVTFLPYLESDVVEKLLTLRLNLSLEYESRPVRAKTTDTVLSTLLVFRLGE